MAGLEVDVWALNATNTIRTGSIIDLSSNYSSIIHVSVALGTADTTAHNGSRIIIQASSAASGNDNWTNIQDFVTLAGTLQLETITNNPLNVGGTTITMASTTGFEAGAANKPSILCFLKDTVDITKSELVVVTAYSLNTSVTLLEGVTNSHTNTAVLNNIAATFAIALPLGTLRARVIYDNTYTTAGCGLYSRTHIVQVSALGSLRYNTTTIVNNLTLDNTHTFILANAASNTITVSLPSAATFKNLYFLKKTDTSANVVTISPNGTDTIDGQSNYLLELQGEFVAIISNGVSTWEVMAE